VTPRTAEIRSALCAVHDPCSVASNIPLNVLDMGLVRDWSVDDGHVTVTLILTSVACFHAVAIVEAIETSLLGIEGVASVDVSIDHERLWQPSDMTARGEASAARRREHTLALTGAHPQQWREAANGADG